MKKLFTLITALTLVFAVAGCKDDTPSGPTDAELVGEATTALLLTDTNQVTDDLDLPATGLHDSVVTWTSSNTAVVGNTGKVTRPAVGEADAVVTLTATITIGDESDTKEFTVRVIAAVPTLDVTIAVFNSDDVAVDDDIVVTGVVFGIVEGAGFQISDGTAFVFVYSGSSEGVALGDTVKVTGQKTIYYGLPEVDTVTSVEVLSSGNTQPAYEVTSIIDLFDEDPFDTAYWSKPITITGLASVDSDGNAVLTATSAEGMAYNIVVYYKSFPAQITALTELAGEIVTVDVIVYGYHDGLGAWRVTVAEDATITSVSPSDAELALWEAGQLDLGDLSEVTEDLALNSVGQLDGTTITWTTDNEAAVTASGVVTRAESGDAVATLTATVTVGAEVVTKDFTVTVKDMTFALETITVAEAIASDVDADPIIVQGIVTAIIGTSKIVIQDATGGPGITTYHSGFNTDNDFALGDEIIIKGTHEIYFGLQELTGLTLIKVVSSDNPVQLATDITVAQMVTDLTDGTLSLQGLNAVFTNLEVVDVDYDAKTGYVVVADDLGNQFIFSAYDIPYSDTFVVGDIISEITVIIWDVYFDAPRVIVMEYPGLSDADALISAADALELPATIADDITLPAMNEEFGVAISWASNMEAVISPAGVVVQPTEGGDVTVLLTATLTIGDETVTKEFTVIVKELSFGIETIAEIIALANDELVVTSELLVSAVIQNGFYVTDGTDYILVYTGGNPEGVTAGDYVTVQGARGSYSGTEQIVDPTFTVVESPVKTITEPGASDDIYSVDQVVAGMTDGTMIGKVVQIYGAISLQGDYGNVYFNNPEDGEVEIEVYYKSPSDSIAALEAQDGMNIIATFYVYSNSRLVFVGATEDIMAVATPLGIQEVINAAMDDAVVLGGVKVADVITNGFYVTDGTDLVFIYTGGNPSDMVVKGAEVLVLGTRGEYKGTVQVTSPKVVVLEETSAIADLVEPTTITSMSDLLAGMADGSLISKMVKVTAVVSIEGSYNNVYINDEVDGEIDVEVYYKSPAASIASLEAQDGNTVTINIYVYNNSSIVFTGEVSETE